ncbi:MAG: hypothetical protein E6Q97_02640 [Desulfurellales bacterium]|nr:MAG: hypothetical protein E6Q97_02640 [Desulfurellales bacterium]
MRDEKADGVALRFGDYWPAAAAGRVSVLLTDWDHGRANRVRRNGKFQGTVERGDGRPAGPICKGAIARVEFLDVKLVPPEDYERTGGLWMDHHLFLSPRRTGQTMVPYQTAFDKLRRGWGSMYRVVLADVYVYQEWREWLASKLETVRGQATL